MSYLPYYYYVDEDTVGPAEQDDDREAEKRPALAEYPVAPQKGDCAHCGFGQSGYCVRSARPVGSPKALKYCVPTPVGDPYVPVALRP